MYTKKTLGEVIRAVIEGTYFTGEGYARELQELTSAIKKNCGSNLTELPDELQRALAIIMSSTPPEHHSELLNFLNSLSEISQAFRGALLRGGLVQVLSTIQSGDVFRVLVHYTDQYADDIVKIPGIIQVLEAALSGSDISTT